LFATSLCSSDICNLSETWASSSRSSDWAPDLPTGEALLGQRAVLAGLLNPLVTVRRPPSAPPVYLLLLYPKPSLAAPLRLHPSSSTADKWCLALFDDKSPSAPLLDRSSVICLFPGPAARIAFSAWHHRFLRLSRTSSLSTTSILLQRTLQFEHHHHPGLSICSRASRRLVDTPQLQSHTYPARFGSTVSETVPASSVSSPFRLSMHSL
jgi:hypothetical protein